MQNVSLLAACLVSQPGCGARMWPASTPRRCLGVTPKDQHHFRSRLAVSLAINNDTRSDRRGELNGVGMSTSSLTRSIVPTLVSACLAFSIDDIRCFPLDSYLALYILGLVKLAFA